MFGFEGPFHFVDSMGSCMFCIDAVRTVHVCPFSVFILPHILRALVFVCRYLGGYLPRFVSQYVSVKVMFLADRQHVAMLRAC